MTMDITSRRSDSKVEAQTASGGQIATSKTIKRSFDVAFLMLPDDKLKQKHLKSSENVFQENNNLESAKNDTDSDDSSKAIEVNKMKSHARYLQNALHKQQIFGDPNLKSKPEFDSAAAAGLKLLPHIQHSEQKSAFTKVNLAKDSRTSPSLSASPDISYQSLSPSPPILNRTYQLHPNIITPNQIFKPSYQNNFVPENFPSPIPLDHTFLSKGPPSDLLQPNFAKMRPMLGHYRHDLSYNYPQFQPPEMLKISQPDLKFSAEMRNPAAAILSTLLPPSLAALSLPAQNICAKCNVSFRMTSDLVYHMRSHHKNEAIDVTKKRREDKLKCPVCAESFRERHHLTRHMTAHQDKEEDEEEPIGKKKDFANFTK